MKLWQLSPAGSGRREALLMPFVPTVVQSVSSSMCAVWSWRGIQRVGDVRIHLIRSISANKAVEYSFLFVWLRSSELDILKFQRSNTAIASRPE